MLNPESAQAAQDASTESIGRMAGLRRAQCWDGLNDENEHGRREFSPSSDTLSEISICLLFAPSSAVCEEPYAVEY